MLRAVRDAARTEAEVLLGQVPDTGDSATGRAVDDFVEQAADALRALDEAVTETLHRFSVTSPEPGAEANPPHSDAYPFRQDRP